MTYSPTDDRMTAEERRAGVSLASIFALRMLGLFLILPVFAVHARDIPGGQDLALVGFALGAYGLTQAFFQIPFGIASDRFGRKPAIVFGLVLFAVGSFVAAAAGDITTIIVGRVLQGAGAISAAVTALAADLTREQHRTKVMAMIGSSIGLVFAGSLVAAPALYAAIGMGGLFALTGILALAAIGLVVKVVPPAPVTSYESMPIRFREVLLDPQLLRLNLGVFILHTVQMAMFVVLPRALVQHGGLPVAEHWKVYLPAVLASFVIMVPAIIAAERKGRVKAVLLSAVVLLALVQLAFYAGGESLAVLAGGLLAFFVAFNILEASLPSLVSRFAPAPAKGAALGIYNTTQALGLFCGGAVGGAVAQGSGAGAVYLLCAVLAATWLAVGASMTQPPQRGRPTPA